MAATTTIAKLVESMLERGVDHAALVIAVEAAEKTLTARLSSPSTRRGTRLPDDWQMSDTDLAFAASRMPEDLITLEAQKFKNYWLAKTGSGATKRDWPATWRNWVLNAVERHHASSRNRAAGSLSTAGRPSSGADAVIAGMGRLADRLAEHRRTAQPEIRKVGVHSDAPPQLGFDPDAKS